MKIDVTTTSTVPIGAEWRRLLRGPEWDRMLADLAKDMGDQARVNIVRDGKRGGSYPELSGYNARRTKGTRFSRVRTARGSSPHSGYARRKELGRTPGRGRHGPGEKLQDTEALRASFDGEIKRQGADDVVEMVARDGVSGRPSNQRLFEIHARGEGNMPVRNPASDMGSYLKRVHRRLEEFLSSLSSRS